MSEYSNDLNQTFRTINYTGNTVLTVGIRAVVALVRFLIHLRNNHVLKEGEVENFKKFISATGGKYDIQSIPLKDGVDREEQISSIKKALEKFGISFSILPDVSDGKDNIFIAVSGNDSGKYAAFIKDYINEALNDKNLSTGDIKRFTGGNTTMINLPDEGVAELKKSFDSVGVPFADVPDLNLYDGKTQILISSNDINTVNSIYSIYRSGLLARGNTNDPGENIVMTEDEYIKTGERTVEEYIASATEEIKKSYEEIVAGERIEEIDLAEGKIRLTSNPEFEKMLNNREFIQLSIDDGSLVNNPDFPLTKELSETNPEYFYCKVPGTYGEDFKVLQIPKSQVFEVDNAVTKSYVAFVSKDEKPVVLGKDGEVSSYKNGEDLYKNFSAPGKGVTVSETPADVVRGDLSLSDAKELLSKDLEELIDEVTEITEVLKEVPIAPPKM